MGLSIAHHITIKNTEIKVHLYISEVFWDDTGIGWHECWGRKQYHRGHSVVDNFTTESMKVETRSGNVKTLLPTSKAFQIIDTALHKDTDFLRDIEVAEVSSILDHKYDRLREGI